MVDRANGKPPGGQERGCSPGGCAGTTQVFDRPAQENGGWPRGRVPERFSDSLN